MSPSGTSSPPPHRQTATLRRVGTVGDPTAWLEELGRWDPGAADLIKQDGEASVVAAQLMGRAVIVKSRPIAGVIAWVRWRLGMSREERQWRGARCLQGANIPTAAPMALASIRRPGEPAQALLILERIAGRSLLEHLGTMTFAEERAVADEVGRLAGMVTAAGLTNRDAKPSNWVVRTAPVTAAVIDTVGIRARAGREPDPAMLSTMVIEAIGVGRRPRRTVRWRALLAYERARTGRPTDSGRDRRTALKHLWRAVAEIVQRHGDPTPKVDPLGGERGR